MNVGYVHDPIYPHLIHSPSGELLWSRTGLHGETFHLGDLQ